MEITKDYMLKNTNYQNLMNGIFFRRQVSQFLNLRVDFSVKNKGSLQLETVNSGFIQNLKTNSIEDLHELERMFGF